MDTSATGNSAPEARIHFNDRIQARENNLKSRWNFGLRSNGPPVQRNTGTSGLVVDLPFWSSEKESKTRMSWSKALITIFSASA